MKTRTYAVAGISAALVAAVFFSFNMTQDDAPAKVIGEPDLFPFVKSMADTRPDGEAKVTTDDKLVVDIALRNLFEYYLTANGEKSIDEIRVETEKELDRKLKPATAAEAKRLLGRYYEYKRALFDVEKNTQLAGNVSGAPRARLAAMQQTRARFFSADESKGLFGFDDAYDMDAIARMEIMQDASLTPEQKRVKIAALDAALPAEIREAREAPMAVVRLEESVTKMREKGASDDEVYRMRAAAISPEAAARLADVDRDESAWKGRINDYLVERKQFLAANPTLSESARESALQQLRQGRFSSDEQRRLGAYE